jgi:hypothetical protein
MKKYLIIGIAMVILGIIAMAAIGGVSPAVKSKYVQERG